MNRSSIRAGMILVAGSLLAIAGGIAVSAAPAHAAPAQVPAPVAAETTTTLPLFGAPLTVDVTYAPGGAISAVSVDPADSLTASIVKPNKVRFVNEAGTARVQVSTRHGDERVEARAGALADVSGPGSWSGDLFGTGVTTTVGFVVGAAADGTPDITNITTSDPTAQIGTVDHDTGDDAARAKVSILFTNGIQQRRLSIRVTAATPDDSSDDSPSAKVSVRLSDVAGQRLPADEVVGSHTWNGMLCDGTAASITYTVDANGTISGVTATPATADVESDDHGARVEFSDRERVRVRVKSSDGGTELRVEVDERIRCERTDPTVNTPVDESLDDDDHDDRRGRDSRDGDDDRGDDDGSRRGRSSGDDDGSRDGEGND